MTTFYFLCTLRFMMKYNINSSIINFLIRVIVGGHDSKEDAIACMELILWKAKEEAKLQ